MSLSTCEEELFSAPRDLFNLEVDLVFYDLTPAYFEGDGPQIAEAFEGRYFLSTNAPPLSPQDAVDAYYTLQEVERAFRSMKDFLKLRPTKWQDCHRSQGCSNPAS